jgi:hypothetical protein
LSLNFRTERPSIYSLRALCYKLCANIVSSISNGLGLFA